MRQASYQQREVSLYLRLEGLEYHASYRDVGSRAHTRETVPNRKAFTPRSLTSVQVLRNDLGISLEPWHRHLEG